MYVVCAPGGLQEIQGLKTKLDNLKMEMEMEAMPMRKRRLQRDMQALEALLAEKEAAAAGQPLA